MTNTHTLVPVCIFTVIVGFAQIAQARAPQQQPAQGQAQATTTTAESVTSADVTDQEVEQFAKSYEDVSKIQEDTEKQLESVQESTAVARVKQEANQKMAEAVQAHGLKVERFNLIARSLNQDATLKTRVQQKIQELRQPA